MHRILPFALPALLAACDTTSGGALQKTVPANACAGGVLPAMAGRNIGEYRFAQNLDHRIIAPGMSATDDTRQGRLTIRVDDKGWITAANCQ